MASMNTTVLSAPVTTHPADGTRRKTLKTWAVNVERWAYRDGSQDFVEYFFTLNHWASMDFENLQRSVSLSSLYRQNCKKGYNSLSALSISFDRVCHFEVTEVFKCCELSCTLNAFFWVAEAMSPERSCRTLNMSISFLKIDIAECNSSSFRRCQIPSKFLRAAELLHSNGSLHSGVVVDGCFHFLFTVRVFQGGRRMAVCKSLKFWGRHHD